MRTRLAAGLLLLATARALAAPAFSNFQSHACLGNTSTATYVSGTNATVYTTAPDFLVTVSASGLPNLNANDDGTAGPAGASPVPASLPQISTTAAGLQGAWEFESNGNDSSAAGNNLTFSPANCDAGTYGAGPTAFMGNAWQPSGACRASAAHNFSFGSNSFSADVWIKTSASGAYWPIMASCSGAQSACLELALAPNGAALNPSFSFGGSGNGVACTNTVNDSKWHHLAFVYNNSTQQQKILVDGIPCGTNVATMTVTASTIYVGGNASGFGNTNGLFAKTGSIDSLRLYNQAFSDGTYGLHARGNIYRVNGGESYDGKYSDTFYPGLAAPSQPITTWTWALPSSSSRVLMSTAPNSVEFAEEDLSENIGFQTYTVNVNQTQLSTPTPTVSFPGSDPQHSMTFGMGGFVCDTTNTNYVVTFSSGGTRNVTGPFSLPLTGLTPNTQYGIKATAAYTDAGGSGATVTSGPSGVVSAYTYANIPGMPTITQTGGTSAAVVLSTDAGSPWNNAGATNPAGTLINVEASADGGASYSQVLNYSPSNSGPLSITGLPNSSSLIFHSRAVNGSGVITSSGPATTAAFVTQPSAPAGLAGAPATAGGACGKTTIHWSWNAVTAGSGSPTNYLLSRSTGTAANGPCGGLIAGASCDETGFPPGYQVSDVVQASDTAVGLPYPLSAASLSATAQTAPAANGPITFASGTALSGGIQWTWTPPAYLCAPWSYVIHDAGSGALLATLSSSPGPSWTQAAGPNVLSQIVVQAQDPYDTVGAVSSTVTAFSQANAPTSLAAASVSSGSLLVSWSANGNPNYTRYEVSISTSGNGYSILEPIAANYTQTSLGVGSLSPGASYYFQVRAVNGSAAQGSGTAFTAYATAAFQTASTAPVLNIPVPNALNPTTQIDWSWADVGGVSRYDLITATTGVVVASVLPPYAGTVRVTQTLSGPNTPAEDAVVAYNAQGLASTSTAVTFFTDSAQPAAAASPVLSASSSAITFAWSANGNPAGTVYQVSLSTDAAFALVVGTQNFVGTTGTAAGLFPATTYYAQVRSVSGSGYASASISLGSAATAADSQVTVATAPASVYVPGAGTAGLWHFDESSGTAALDSSGFGDAGALLCAPGPCVSTPTYASGRPGMGTALDFSGLIGGMVRVSSGPQFGFTNALTVSAWVLPQSAAMAANAAIVVKGPQGSEDWFLRVVGGHYQFGVTSGGARSAVLSNAAVSVGQWTSLIGVFDGAAQKLKIYVNGALDNSASPVLGAISASTQPITIGAGQAVSGGVYGETFTGAIDEVQAAGAAYSDAQASAYYQSASVSTVSVSGSGKVLIALPPDAFGAPAVIYASQDPINHPLTTSPAVLAAGLLNLPTGQVLVPGSLVEIVPVVNGQPFTSLLGSSATIGLPFTASGGLVAGLSPPVPASSLRVYTFNPIVSRWTALPTVVDQQSGMATAQTPHFSIFTLLGASSISGDAASARAYPAPWKRGAGGRFDAPALTFDQLPQAGVIRILTLAGEQVAELPFNGADAGKVQWDGRNGAGRPAAGGVYFAYIKPASGPAKLLKFAIE